MRHSIKLGRVRTALCPYLAISHPPLSANLNASRRITLNFNFHMAMGRFFGIDVHEAGGDRVDFHLYLHCCPVCPLARAVPVAPSAVSFILHQGGGAIRYFHSILIAQTDFIPAVIFYGRTISRGIQMFYGIPPGREKEMQQALATVADIYKGQFYCNDMLICLWRNLSFQHDKKFIKCFYDSVTNEQEQSLIWRLHTLAWAAKNALSVEGDFVECGVFKGFCSSVILKYLDFQDLPRQAYLYDTFEGLPEKTSTETERRAWDYTQYDAEAIYKGVCEKFSVYKNVNIVRGIVPDSFEVAVPEKIAFLHIDMNSAQAEMLEIRRAHV